MKRSGAEGERPPRRVLLWATLLATPFLWFVWFMAAYVYTEATCGAAGQASQALGVTVTTVLLLATLVVAGASGVLTAVTFAVRGRARRTAPIHDDFLPEVGLFMGLLVTFVVTAHLIPVAMIGACG